MNDPFESDPHWVTFAGEPEEGEDLESLWTAANDALRARCRLACFTMSGSSSWTPQTGFGDGYAHARMWAQYGDAHSGVCLAFDQSRLIDAAKLTEQPGTRLFDAGVRYRSDEEPASTISMPLERVRRDLPGLVDDLFPGLVEGLYFNKTADWSSEAEYRFLIFGDVALEPAIDIRSALTGIFLGRDFPWSRFVEVRDRCPELWAAGRVFQVRWRNGSPYPVPAVEPMIWGHSQWNIPPAPTDP